MDSPTRILNPEQRAAQLLCLAGFPGLTSEARELLTTTAEHVEDLWGQVQHSERLEADFRETIRHLKDLLQHRRNNTGAKPGPNSLTNQQAMDIIREAANWLTNYDNGALRGHNLERAADRFECIVDNLSDNEFELKYAAERLVELNRVLVNVAVAIQPVKYQPAETECPPGCRSSNGLVSSAFCPACRAAHKAAEVTADA